MSQVIGLDGKPRDHQTLDMDATDAREALRALLAKLDNGEIKAVNWLFIFDAPGSEAGKMLRQVLDSGLTIEKAVYMIEDTKHEWFRLMRPGS